mgnify:CR=1 FL=1
MYFDRDSYQQSVRRAHEERWRVRGRARVVHAEVWAVPPGTAVVMPKEFCGRN